MTGNFTCRNTINEFLPDKFTSNQELKHESRGAARKPCDAKTVLFCSPTTSNYKFNWCHCYTSVKTTSFYK